MCSGLPKRGRQFPQHQKGEEVGDGPIAVPETRPLLHAARTPCQEKPPFSCEQDTVHGNSSFDFRKEMTHIRRSSQIVRERSRQINNVWAPHTDAQALSWWEVTLPGTALSTGTGHRCTSRPGQATPENQVYSAQSQPLGHDKERACVSEPTPQTGSTQLPNPKPKESERLFK